MRRLLPLALALCLLSGCAMARQTAERAAADTYLLYFTTAPEDAMGGDAVASVPVVVEGGGELDAQTLAADLLRRLLEGPGEGALTSPIPQGTQLLSLEVEGAKAHVDLSAAYGTLSGVQLTLADYCITLSLAQVPGVSSVSITVQGQELAYRDRQSFRAKDVLLTSSEDVVGSVEAALWFLDSATGALAPEQRTLELYEGDTQAGALLKALLAGPEGKGLTQALPEEFSVLSVWTEEDICYVNLPAAVWESAEENTAGRTVRVLVDSFCSLDSVSGVQLKVEGESRAYFGPVSIGGILQPEA